MSLRKERHLSATVQIFTKAPVLGDVKTRIAVEIGDQGALNLYENMLTSVVSMASNFCSSSKGNLSGGLVEMWLSGSEQHPLIETLKTQHSLEIHHQLDNEDLGWRMMDALCGGLRHAQPVILIGGDCISIDVEYLEETVKAIEYGNNLVIGPAYDGGYVLIAIGGPEILDCFNRNPKSIKDLLLSLFDNVVWSSDRAMVQTLKNAYTLKLPTYLLDFRWDVDRIEDLSRVDDRFMDSSDSNSAF